MKNLDDLKQLFSTKKITRREFIARATALGVAGTMLPTLLSSPAKAAAPKKGGHFIQGVTGGSVSNTLDPATHAATWDMIVEMQVRNYLVEIDHNFQPIPELAESWESSPDAKKWVFKLRKGVEFHDGKTLDAEDVIYSLNHHRGPDSKSAAKPFLEPVTELKADGKHTLIFELSQGVADFPFILGDYHLAIFQAGTQGKEFDKGIGTGGYILEKWEPGVSAVTRRNPNYWKAGRAHFDKVTTLGIGDVNARTNALKTGQIHYMDECDRKTVHLLKKFENIVVTAVTGTFHSVMPMNTQLKPYDDNNVRLGLKHAIDRDDMVKRIMNDYAVVGNDHPIAPVNRYFAEDLPQRQYDPDKARFYMKKAGMLDHTFNLHTADIYSGAKDIATLYAEHARKAGIKVNVVQEPSDGYWSDVWLKKEFVVSYWGGRPVEDMMFSVGYASGAPWNESRWEHEKFNQLLVAARGELDEKKRAALYAEMQRIVRDEGGTIIPMFTQIVEAHSDKIAHGTISAHMQVDGGRNAERWWFA